MTKAFLLILLKIDDKTLQVTVPDTGNIYIEAAVDKVPLSENTIGLVDGQNSSRG